jgi:LmbE family N-acetylglucosaminyl deacetylase
VLRLAALIPLILLFTGSHGRAGDAPRQGAELLKTDLLGVFAHPDDETGMAASLARYARGEHRQIVNVYVTRGEGGGNMVGTQAGAALGVLRETELRDCLRTLGVRSAFFLDQEDFFYTESHAATLRKWNREAALRKLVRLVRTLRPEIIVTMNPAPNPGQHGHHQAAGVLATDAFAAAADPSRYPEQLRDEGLAPWQARKLFFGGSSGSTHLVSIATTEPLIDGRTPADIAGEALSNHRSQAFGGFLNSPWLRRPQGFTLVKSTVIPSPNASDLFEGLPGSDPVRLVSFAPRPLQEPLAFRPRPAIRNFLDWADSHDIRHVTAGLPADVPVVAGEENRVLLDISTELREPKIAPLNFTVEAGWPAHAAANSPLITHVQAPRTTSLPIRVEVPADALADTILHARVNHRGAEIHTTTRLHPVPLALIPRVRRAPSLETGDEGWQAAALLDIGTNRAWQGHADSPADCSGTARVLHDGKSLFVQVDVRDDVVVSNIEPNDIRGHWRSDSVEICLDPGAGAEDTTGCFKIGIFPFDTTGKVRAARDADARQGPVEQTAPGLRLASERTPGGYRVRATIPFNLVMAGARLPKRLGFNVLLYDGDKRDAARGENINRTRLAWAPRSGVQGRPEDWGRIDLQ